MATHPLDTFKTQGMRAALVQELVRKGIKNPEVLAAIGKVPRHLFLDSALLEHAYEDKAMPIGEGQTISQPYTVAVQSELLDIKRRDRVLEVGTGSGYQAAVLVEMGAKVFTIERVRALHLSAQKFLPTLGYRPQFFYGDGTLGLPTYGPFDAIIVTAGAPVVPETLVQQLTDGGRLIIPVGDLHNQTMLKIRRKGNFYEQKAFDGFKFVPLLGKEGWTP